LFLTAKNYNILMMNKRRIIIFLAILIIIALSVAGWFYLKTKVSKNALIEIQAWPPSSKITLIGPKQTEKSGFLKIYTLPGHYQLKVSHEGYYDWNWETTLLAGDSLKEEVWLIAKNPPSEPFIKGEIVDFKISDSSQVIFWQKTDKDNYQLNIYQRPTKKTINIVSANNPPAWFKTSQKGDVALARFNLKTTVDDYLLKNGGYLFIDLSRTYLNKFLDISKRFENKLSELKNKKIVSKQASVDIEQLDFLNEIEKSLLIKTKDGLYLFKILDNELSRLYEGPTSAFFKTKDSLYFLDKDGRLNQYYFQSQELKKLSETSYLEEEKPTNLTSYQVVANNDGQRFLILTPQGRLFLLENNHSQLLAEKALKGLFSETGKIIALLENKIKIWPDEEIPIEKAKALSFFRDNKRVIIQKEDQLLFFDPINNETFSLSQGLKDGFYYEPGLNYLYYQKEYGLYLYSF